MRLCAAEGNAMAELMPAHQATIKLGLDQVEERWDSLNGFVAAAKEKVSAATLYFQLLAESDDFLRDANRSLLKWSRKVSMLDNKKGWNHSFSFDFVFSPMPCEHNLETIPLWRQFVYLLLGFRTLGRTERQSRNRALREDSPAAAE